LAGSWAVEPGEDRSHSQDTVVKRLVAAIVGHQRRNDLVLHDAEVLAKDVAEARGQGAQLCVADNPAVQAVDRRCVVGMLPGCAFQPPGKVHRAPPHALK
jgi:hypothetical protein